MLRSFRKMIDSVFVLLLFCSAYNILIFIPHLIRHPVFPSTPSAHQNHLTASTRDVNRHLLKSRTVKFAQSPSRWLHGIVLFCGLRMTENWRSRQGSSLISATRRLEFHIFLNLCVQSSEVEQKIYGSVWAATMKAYSPRSRRWSVRTGSQVHQFVCFILC